MVRDDGTSESAELETKSLLVHDFIHYAIEAEAGLVTSFWGLVNDGHSFLALAGKDAMAGTAVPRDEIGMTEMLVGASTRFMQGTSSSADVIAGLTNAVHAMDITLPPYVNEAMLSRAVERFRRVMGLWRSTPFGETMELIWPAP